MSSSFYDDAARDLPNFPRPVIEQWFEHALSRGESWPPAQDQLGVPASDVWRGVLGGYPLAYWRFVTWTREHAALTIDELEPRTASLIVETAQEFMNLAPPKPCVTTRNYRERIRGFFLVLQSTRTLPVPPLLLKLNTGFEVLDGYHRLVAVFVARALHTRIDDHHECWVARVAQPPE